MIQQQLYEWITHPERLNRDTLYELRTLLARYPYFQTVRLLYLKNLFLLHDITFGEELRKAALYVADRKILFYLIEGERFTVSSFEKQDLPKEEAGLDRTLSLIDTFLSSLPEEPVVMELPMDVTTDYTSFLLHEEEHVSDDIPQMKGQNLIDNFIEKSAEEPLLPQLGIKEAAPVKNKVSEEEESEAREQAQNASTVIRSPMTGTVIPLEEVPDEAFAGAMMGDGAAIVPTDGIVQAPADGEVTFVFPTKHAVGFRTDAGHEMLIHVGIDTVSLSGDGFEAFVSDGDHVRAGEPLLKVDIRKIGDRVPSMASPILFTDLAENMEVRVLKKGQIHAGEPFMEVHRKADVGFC